MSSCRIAGSAGTTTQGTQSFLLPSMWKVTLSHIKRPCGVPGRPGARELPRLHGGVRRVCHAEASAPQAPRKLADLSTGAWQNPDPHPGGGAAASPPGRGGAPTRRLHIAELSGLPGTAGDGDGDGGDRKAESTPATRATRATRQGARNALWGWCRCDLGCRFLPALPGPMGLQRLPLGSDPGT